MREVFRRGTQRLRQSAREYPVSIVAAAHDGLFVDQIVDYVAPDLLVERAQSRVEKYSAQSADVLPGAVMMLDGPVLEHLTVHAAGHHSVEKAPAIKRRPLLLVYVLTQMRHEIVRGRRHGSSSLCKRGCL